MLGEKIGEMSGKQVGKRVTSVGNHPFDAGVQMEVTAEGAGKILGVDFFDTGSYTAVMQNGGTLRGNGQGMSMTKDGEGVTWVANGLGHLKQDGSVSWRGSVFYQTTSSKLARLNQNAHVFEYEVDAAGNFKGSIWEWK